MKTIPIKCRSRTIEMDRCYQMFQEHPVSTGMDWVSEGHKQAMLQSSLGTDGHPICRELCDPITKYAKTGQLKNRVAPKQSTLNA